MNSTILIYGAYGYTGELITQEAVRQGLRPMLAGRREAPLRALAEEHGLSYRVADLEDPDALETLLNDAAVVIHCAGPFSQTARPMARACLHTGTHYIDITGEIDVFETLAALDRRAKDAGVMLMPGGGFDVVPSDCLALRLKEALPTATHLTLAFHNTEKPSHGTMLTVLKNIPKGCYIRQDGKFCNIPLSSKTRTIDYGDFTASGTIIAWGDVSTAWHSTGIPNIEVYMSSNKGMQITTRLLRYLRPLIALPAVQRYLARSIKPGGPDEAERNSHTSQLWGEVRDDAGNAIEMRLHTPESYTLTALTAILIARKILDGNAPVGYQTPAMAYGCELISEIDGVRWV